MAASLATQYYQLGKYAPNDLTDYLVTYNGTMDKIDTAIHGAQDAADTAQAQSDANLNNINAISQNLTATNKNVENLGKTQTAQQTEIDELKASFKTVGITDSFDLQLTNRTSAGSVGAICGHGVGGVFHGECVIDVGAGKVEVDKTINGASFVTIGYVSGNPFKLKELSTFNRGYLLLMDPGTYTVKTYYSRANVFYDPATDTTRLAINSNAITFEETLTGLIMF